MLKDRLEEVTGIHFNSMLANLYRDGHDSVAWHSDDELCLGPEPTIASLSFGDTRNFDYERSLHRYSTSWFVYWSLQYNRNCMMGLHYKFVTYHWNTCTIFANHMSDSGMWIRDLACEGTELNKKDVSVWINQINIWLL